MIHAQEIDTNLDVEPLTVTWNLVTTSFHALKWNHAP